MIDFQKLRVDELRYVLVNHYGMTEQEASTLTPKSKVVEHLKTKEANQEKLEKLIKDTLAGRGQPNSTEPGWTEYVLSHLTDDERFNDNPTVDGLRRLVEKFLGRIIGSQSKVNQCPSPENGNRAVVLHSIMIEVKDNTHVFDGVADVYSGNTDPKYAIFPTSLAETRAEGRALRRALKLKKVVAAEELSQGTPENHEEEVSYITDQQITVLDTLCSKGRGMNVSVEAIINKNGVKYSKINKVPKNEAAKLIKELSDLQQDTSKIEPHLIGYNPDWRNSFYEINS